MLVDGEGGSLSNDSDQEDAANGQDEERV